MAKLSKADLLKRDNIKQFVSRLNEKGQFRLGDANGKALICTGRFKLGAGNAMPKPMEKLSESMMRQFCENADSQIRLTVEVKEVGATPRYRNFTEFYKDKTFGGVAAKAGGGGSERQERGLIELINESVFPSGTVKVPTFKTGAGIAELIGARKNEGMSAVGKEPYIDIFLKDKAGKEYGISCKGTTAPSLAGGGLAGLKQVVPSLIDKLYVTLEKHMQSKYKLKEGDIVNINTVPDIYIKIPDDYIETILRGTPAMGGPVTHMYIGPMDVRGQHQGKTLTLNGKFYTVEEYMRKIPDFYFRIRRRDVDSEAPTFRMKVNYNTKNREGYPVLMQGEKRSKPLVRIVIQDSVPANADIAKLL